ncbi:MAG TPA: selenocysteine-specific translation elongation factor [Acetobacteraceae bacterium]|nr:selenocysteine-specific translation elongation factor [Acetobacteraceae bacterium]
MIVGTAGHIDHGKTTLVRALTGVDADRLPEEKRRGMTIDLGYAYAGPLGFVDVPGHERFVHTMLAGAGGIDAALLVVAADDGVMPQTREHTAILHLLGIDRAVVALTRVDRARGRIAAVSAEIRNLLGPTALAGAPVLPVCAPTGEGIDALRDALLALGRRPRDQSGYARLAVDRAFTLGGVGLVVTGTLVAGTVAVDDRLVISPSDTPVRVRGLHANNRLAMQAEAGQRVALNMTGAHKDQVARGDWVLAPPLHAPTAVLDAQVALIADPPPRLESTPVHIHLAATHVTGRASTLGDGGFVRLVLDRPIGALAGDRLVLRDAAAMHTIGGGMVVDPWPPRRGARTPARLARLEWLSQPTPEALRGELASGWTDFAAFSRAHNLPLKVGAALLAQADGVLVGPLAVAAGAPGRMRSEITHILAAHHKAHPDEPGLQPDRLALRLAAKPPAALFRAIVDTALRRGEVQQDGPWLRLPIHRATLSSAQERLWASCRPLIAAERFRPPRTRDLARALHVAEPDMRATLKRLARAGRLVEVAHDHFFLRETVAEMVGIAAALSREAGGLVSTPEFRDRLDNGRKVAIQVLEFFDSVGVTRRDGEARRIRPDRLKLFAAPET